jgi:hypothetical protein
MDVEGDFTLELWDRSGVIQSEFIFERSATADKFENVARAIIDRLAKREAFVGTYTYGEK